LRCQRLQRRDGHHRQAGPECQSLRHGDADANTGECAGTDARRNAVQGIESEPGLRQYRVDHTEQRFGMSAPHLFKHPAQRRVGEQRHGAGLGCRIER
jgi:hypothetical protein